MRVLAACLMQSFTTVDVQRLQLTHKSNFCPFVLAAKLL